MDKEKLDARISQDKIGSVYDGIAPIYDIWSKLTESRAAKKAINLANIKDGQTILEVAVGTGIVFFEIVKSNPNGLNIGIDLSQGMLDKSIQRLNKLSTTNYQLDLGTAFDLKIESNTIDTLMNNYMFDLIPFKDMSEILIEFNRVLKTRGQLVLVNMTEGEKYGSGLYEFIYRISPKTLGGCRGVKLSEQLKQAGFQVASREYCQQMFFPSEVISAIKQ